MGWGIEPGGYIIGSISEIYDYEDIVLARFYEQYGDRSLFQPKGDTDTREPTDADVDWKFLEEQFSGNDSPVV